MNNVALQRGLLALARLLDYPSAELLAATAELRQALQQMPLPNTAPRRQLVAWVEERQRANLLDLQADYVAHFDRGRAVSLLMFEHVHGESRDRGQAMVDLLEEYRAAGFQLDSRELPDYLPVLLEFLSVQDDATIGRWLGDISEIIALIAARLYERDSRYALILHTLLALIGEEERIQTLGSFADSEEDDRTPAALDSAWEEAAVTFSPDADQACDTQGAVQQRMQQARNDIQEEVVRVVEDMPSPSRSGDA